MAPQTTVVSNFKQGEAHRPRCAGHRGFKSSFPENTIAAMRGAAETGATIVEMDIQVSKDDVVVICHDATTLRCFGKPYIVSSTNYHGGLDQLRTLEAPHEPMPTFEQVVRLLAEDPQYKNVQLMLDVKRNNDPSIITSVVKILRDVNPDLAGFWSQKMIFGIWIESVLEACEREVPEIPVIHIGFSSSLARRFLEHDQVQGISMNHLCLKFLGGTSLVNLARQKNKMVYSWTVNSLNSMQWAVALNLDGIVTDHPDVYARFMEQLTQDEIDKVYAISHPTTFYSWLETFVLFPYDYIYIMIKVRWQLFKEWLNPDLKQA